MRRLFLTLLAVFIVGMIYGNINWNDVNNRSIMGDYEGMHQLLDLKECKQASDTVKWHYWMGVYYYWMSYEDTTYRERARDMFDSAIRYKEEHHVKNVSIGDCYLHLGEISYLAKNYKEGIENLQKARCNFPYNMRCPKNAKVNSICRPKDPVYKGLGMCYAMLGKYKKALTYLDSCDSKTKDAYSATRMKGKVYALKGDHKTSYRYYDEFVSQIRVIVQDSFQSFKTEPKNRETWWMSVRPFITDCWRLENSAAPLLYDVALLTKGILLQQDSASLMITHSDIREALAPGSVAVEWMVYENGGKRQLGAVVLRSDGTTKFVHTATDEQLIEWSKDSYGIFDNEDCVKAIWSDAMIEAIGGAEKVYFAPDGILNQIGIEYMFPDKGTHLYRLTSTRELLKQHSHNYASAAIFGDIDYDLAKSDTSTITIDNDEEAYQYAKQRNMHFKKLEHSGKECDSIFAIRHSETDTLVRGHSATERSFRSIAGNYNMLFISTHGYCEVKTRYESSDFPRLDKIDHSLSESGLLFCGYNAEQSERTGITDGILSARELCGMKMRNVNLCVVSACEGAHGRASADGTYGIQRGLKAAGVDAMILSLWRVNDEATQVFMTYFYEEMADKGDVHEAFWEARRRLSKKYNRTSCYNAFILIDVI